LTLADSARSIALRRSIISLGSGPAATRPKRDERIEFTSFKRFAAEIAIVPLLA